MLSKTSRASILPALLVAFFGTAPAKAGDTAAIMGWSSHAAGAGYRCAVTGNCEEAETFARNMRSVEGLAQGQINYQSKMNSILQRDQQISAQNYISQMKNYAWQSYREAQQAAAAGDYATAQSKLSEAAYYNNQANSYR